VPFSGFNRGLVRVTDPRYLNPQNVGQAIKGNIPGLSHSVPARVNTLAQIRAADNQGLSAMFNPYQVSPLLVTEDELQSKIKMALKIDNARLLGKKINKKTGKEVDAVLGDYKRYQQQQLQKVDKLERLQNRR
jgi:phosphoketolase